MAQSEVSSVDYVASESAEDTGNQSGDSSDSSLFKTQCVPSPTQKQRHPTVKYVTSPASVETDSSSDSSLEPRPLTLKAIFERFKKKKRKKRKKRKYKPKLRPRGRPSGTKNTRRSQIDAKRIKDKGAVFPFLESESGRKPLPWKKLLTYEQAVARGFFHHIEKLKYEHHLKECLKQMHAGEDLEKEDLDSRRHKYMDDDGPLSPIAEPLTEDEATNPQSECDIKLVEHSCFIISSEFSRKRNLEQEKIKKESLFSKKAKAKDATQRGHRRTRKGDEHGNIEVKYCSLGMDMRRFFRDVGVESLRWKDPSLSTAWETGKLVLEDQILGWVAGTVNLQFKTLPARQITIAKSGSSDFSEKPSGVVNEANLKMVSKDPVPKVN